MVCAAWDEALDRYLDGELADADLPALEKHLAGCPSCSAEALRRRELRAAIRDAGVRFVPDPAFRSRVVASLRGPRRRVSRLWLLPIAAALLAGVGLAALQGAKRAKREAVAAEYLDVHVAALGSTAPLDVLSSDSHTVKPWFEGRIPFTFDLPDLTGTAFQLLGGRVVWVGRTPGALLLFRLRQHRISVFIFRERAGLARLPGDPAMEKDLSFRILSWRDQGLEYSVVGDTEADDLRSLAVLLRAAARR